MGEGKTGYSCHDPSVILGQGEQQSVGRRQLMRGAAAGLQRMAWTRVSIRACVALYLGTGIRAVSAARSSSRAEFECMGAAGQVERSAIAGQDPVWARVENGEGKTGETSGTNDMEC